MRNWAGNYEYGAKTIDRPQTVEQLQEIVSRAKRIRAIGSRHSFNGISDSDELITLDDLPTDLEITGSTVSISGAWTYGELAVALQHMGLALHNLASLPHISIAGAVSTATHGSGDGLGNLATAVASLGLVTSNGELITASRGDRDFDGMVVGLGSLGAVVRITLDVQPAYEMSQRVFEDLPWRAFEEHLDEIYASGYSVSAFTSWTDGIEQLWVNSRDDGPPSMFGTRQADADRHPIVGLDPVNCTEQLGVPGPWCDRLPHFRLGFTPSSGEELQSEFFVGRGGAIEAFDRIRSVGPRIAPVLQVSEIRTVAADDLWMSPQYGRDSVAIHFTFTRGPGVDDALRAIEGALAPLDARPHWGKLFHRTGNYERANEFADLVQRLDPRGAFRNAWFANHVSG